MLYEKNNTIIQLIISKKEWLNKNSLLTALQMCYNENNAMMACGCLSSCSGEFNSGTCLANALAPFMAKLPQDPINNSDNDVMVD